MQANKGWSNPTEKGWSSVPKSPLSIVFKIPGEIIQLLDFIDNSIVSLPDDQKKILK